MKRPHTDPQSGLMVYGDEFDPPIGSYMGIPVYSRQGCPPGMIYFLNEDCLSIPKPKKQRK